MEIIMDRIVNLCVCLLIGFIYKSTFILSLYAITKANVKNSF